jgi:hypothetical protein
MAGRPLKQGADWFKHDRDMRNDPKVLALRRRYGCEGYSVWVMTLEVLTDSRGFACQIDGTAPDLFAGDFGIAPDLLMEIWNYCAVLGLLQRNNDQLYSSRHQERMADLIATREYNAMRKAEQRSSKRVKTDCPAGQSKCPAIIRPDKSNVPRDIGIVRHLEESRVKRGGAIIAPPPTDIPTTGPVYVGVVGAPDGAAAPLEHDDWDDEPETKV